MTVERRATERAWDAKVGRRGTGWPGVPVDRNPGVADRLPPTGGPETRRERRTAFVWNLAWECARRLPEPVAFWVADLAGRVAWHRAAAGRGADGSGAGPMAQVTANLARVMPSDQVDVAVRRAFRSYARYWVESFRAADLADGDVIARTESTGMDGLDAVLDEGRGAVVLLAHHGSWDVAARWAESLGYHLAVVAEVVRPRALFEKFVRLREGVGLEVVPLTRRRGGRSEAGDGQGARSMSARLTAVLAANHLVGLLADRDLTGKAPAVELFGAPCRLPVGPVVLSRRTGAPIVPITMLQLPRRRWRIVVLEPIRTEGMSLEDGCAAMAAAIEQLVLLDPVQWHAFQPLFEDARRAPA